MRREAKRTPNAMSLLLLAGAVMACGVTWAPAASAQVPPRFYWKSLSGAQAVPLIYMSMSGNANPIDPARLVVPGGNVEATVAPVGYARTFTLFDRAAMAAALVPMGSLSGEMTVFGNTFTEGASGFGDPLLELSVNVLGKPPIRTMPDLLRYEPGFSLDLLADVAVPVGEYDGDQPLNMGQNRWYGRVATPIVWQLGAWVPGRRTTFECLPSLWLFGTNDDYVGRTLETDPMLQVEGHLTRDLSKDLWASLDGTWIGGGVATIDGVEGEALGNLAVGYTLGYHVNENLQFTFAYMATVDDTEPTDLRMDGFRASVVYGWHPLIEGIGRLKGGE